LRHTKAELLVGSAKGVENFETVKKSVEVYTNETLDHFSFCT